jgi:hypothetical protein
VKGIFSRHCISGAAMHPDLASWLLVASVISVAL